MRNCILSLFIFLAMGAFADALAGSYTINTTAAQDIKLNKIATKLGLTPEQVIAQSAAGYIKSVATSFEIQQRRRALERLDNGELPPQIEADLTAILEAYGD